MNLSPEYILIIILSIWSSVLSLLFFKFYSYYSRLSAGSSKESLAQLLDGLDKNNSELKKGLEYINTRCDKLESEGKLHIQKVGLLRFNPFKDTGGDQSFILALVDETDTGVVISSLHTRTGTRWYAKQVIKGKGIEHDLSDEENKALKEARKIVKS